MGGEKKNKGWRRGRRTTATQSVQMTRHLIICEGKQTEPLYFEGMKKALGAVNGRKLAVVVRGTGRHALDLLDCALDCCRYAAETYDHVWLVFDRDDFPAADFDVMERKCAELSDSSRTFHALWSNPCFELWPLLHLNYSAVPMGATGCQRQLASVFDRELGLTYRKNMGGLYEALASRRGVAARNAKKLGVHHDVLGEPKPTRRNPSMRVGEIFDELEPYLGNDLG